MAPGVAMNQSVTHTTKILFEGIGCMHKRGGQVLKWQLFNGSSRRRSKNCISPQKLHSLLEGDRLYLRRITPFSYAYLVLTYSFCQNQWQKVQLFIHYFLSTTLYPLLSVHYFLSTTFHHSLISLHRTSHMIFLHTSLSALIKEGPDALYTYRSGTVWATI